MHTPRTRFPCASPTPPWPMRASRPATSAAAAAPTRTCSTPGACRRSRSAWGSSACTRPTSPSASSGSSSCTASATPWCVRPGGRLPRRASVAPPAAGRPAPPPDPDVQEFLDYVRFERGMSANTVSAYGRDLGRFAAFLAQRGVRPAAASVHDVQEFFAGGGGDGPAAGLRTPKLPQQLPRVLSVEEVEAVLAKVAPAGPLGQRDLAALELLYGCGLRASELLGLREGDVDIEGGLVRCVGKGDKERVVPMGGAAAVAQVACERRGRRCAHGDHTLLVALAHAAYEAALDVHVALAQPQELAGA